jgi:hypothetical protein
MSKKKAVLCFVGDYQGYAEKLDAPVYEWERWLNLLSHAPYSFDSIVSLVDDGAREGTLKANRTNVVKAIEDLLTDAKPDDQLVFIYGGHGGVTGTGTRGLAAQALIVYPDGDRNLTKAAIPGTQIAGILDTKRPPIGTDVTFVLDCCYAARNYPKEFGGDGRGDSEGGTVLAAPFALDLREEWAEPVPFVRFAERETDYEKAVVLAACGPYERAHEGDYGGKERLLFTARLLERLSLRSDDFMTVLIDVVNGIRIDYRQTAQVVGNKERAAREEFPGRTDASARVEEAVTARETATSAGVASINARILGIASFVNARKDYLPPYEARVIFPFDAGEWISEPNDLHFACIEFPMHQTKVVEDHLGPSKTYVLGGVEYSRWLLRGHTISILGGALGTFTRSAAFTASVPRLTTLCRELAPYPPRSECFARAPRLDLFAAFLDIPSGSVNIGSQDGEETDFFRVDLVADKNIGPSVATLNTPRFVTVNIPVNTERAEIVLEPYGFPGRKDLVVRLDVGATFLVANAREIDITGNGGIDPYDPVSRRQFMLYYNLAPFVPNPPVLPESGQVPVDDCSVTDFP